MVPDEEIVLMKKAYIALAAAVLLTGCGSQQVQEKLSETVAESVSVTTEAEVQQAEESFYGVLMDECCSDIDDPALHETNCMFMDECRESGYGLDIQQADGSWKFFMFDEAGQQLTWDYLNTTERQDGLFVTVTGVLDNEVIKVSSIKES